MSQRSRRGPCKKRSLKRWNGNAYPISAGRSYDQCAGAIKFWLDRGLSEETAEIMAGVRRSWFSPLCRHQDHEPDLDYKTHTSVKNI
jgi:hypothetical protein